MPDATDTDPTRQAFEPAYRVAPGERSVDRWVVIPVATEANLHPAPVIVDVSREVADKECARLNEIAAAWEPGDGRADKVLGRMLGMPRKAREAAVDIVDEASARVADSRAMLRKGRKG